MKDLFTVTSKLEGKKVICSRPRHSFQINSQICRPLKPGISWIYFRRSHLYWKQARFIHIKYSSLQILSRQFQRTFIIVRMYSKISILFASLLATTIVAAPISTAELAADASFSYNLVMTSGAAQFAAWVPTDGSAYSSSSLTCLNVGSSSVGSCSISSIDQVGVVSGYTCFFSGSNGWSGSASGNGGWTKVSPPQTITAIACVG